MLTQADVQRRRIGGAVAALIGAILIVLAFLAFTGSLGATDKSEGASEEAQSAGAQSSQPADPSATGEAGESGEASESGDPGSSEASDSEAPADAKAPLTVLNGGGVGGLAGAGQAEFEAGGWEVTEIANYTGAQLAQSTVFYPNGDDDAQAAAEALAAQFDELIAEQAPSGLGYDGVVVVLTGDWTPGG